MFLWIFGQRQNLAERENGVSHAFRAGAERHAGIASLEIAADRRAAFFLKSFENFLCAARCAQSVCENARRHHRADKCAAGGFYAAHARAVARGELRAMKLKEAARKVEDGIEETLTYCDFPSEHWTRIRTNNVIERLNREIRRRTRVVGTFPDGNSALMLVCARLRHVAGTQWGCKKYMNMKHLEAAIEDAFIAG